MTQPPQAAASELAEEEAAREAGSPEDEAVPEEVRTLLGDREALTNALTQAIRLRRGSPSPTLRHPAVAACRFLSWLPPSRRRAADLPLSSQQAHDTRVAQLDAREDEARAREVAALKVARRASVFCSHLARH